MSASVLAVFTGEVRVQRGAGAVNLSLRGRPSDAASDWLEVLFSGASPVTVPAPLGHAEVLELTGAAPGQRQFVLRHGGGELHFTARSVQLHRDVGKRFWPCLPRPPAALRLRLGLSVGVWLLRYPRALAWLRRRTG